MRTTESPSYDISERGDHLEVRGTSERQLTDALVLLDRVRAIQADHVAATRAELVHALMAHNVSLTPPATLAQAQRLAAQHDRLLATPVFTHESLQAVRGDAKESTTRTWLTRRRAARALFTVVHNGRTLIPAFQFDDQNEPRPELRPILAALVDGGIREWALWTWLTSPTSYLSGEIPEQVARTAPLRALAAAERVAVPVSA